jgi:hypothetical protein
MGNTTTLSKGKGLMICKVSDTEGKVNLLMKAYSEKANPVFSQISRASLAVLAFAEGTELPIPMLNRRSLV